MSYNKLSLEEKLLSKASQQGECLVWFGQKCKRGYGRLRLDGRLQRAHRLMYELRNGPIPAGAVVMHSCDNRACINPAHLSVGTQRENIHDMINKGRSNRVRGERHPKAKLTGEEVKEIRRRFVSYDRTNGARALGREFGVTWQSILAVVSGKSWDGADIASIRNSPRHSGDLMKRDVFTMQLPLGQELAIDNFAGGGGASTGIAMGLGREVDVAINHDGEALAMHAANHPTTAHYTEDVFSVHPGFVTRQLPIGLAWFSPDCKHFSKAKGSKPVEKKIRGLAWVTLKWATFQMPRVIMLENVEEFQDWGPLGEDNKPIKALKGRTFKAFVAALTTGIPNDHPDLQEIYDVLGHDFPIERLHAGLGYKVEWKVLRACDYGTPTIRKRLFLIARRDNRPIVWPVPTHGDPKTEAVKDGKLQPWRTAAECIDWSIPCPSIFERKRPLKDATLRRIAKGIMKFVVNSADPFIVGAGGPAYSGKPSAGDKPFGTLTAENHRAVVQPILAPVMTEHANASSPRCMPADEPLRTICAQVKGGHHALIAPTLMHVTHQGSDRNAAVDQPIATVTGANRGEQALILATLIDAAHAETSPNGVKRWGSGVKDIEAPFGTVTGSNNQALVTAFLAKHYSGVVGTGVDVPTGTITTSDHHSIVTAHLEALYSQKGNEARASDADEPMKTVTASARHAMVASHLVKLRGTSTAAPTDAPLGTVSAGGMHHAEVRAFLIKYYSEGGQDQSLSDPMHTIPTKDRLGLVTIRGEDYAIVDIGMRMLTPRELARAQGFPDSYILDPVVTKTLSRTGKQIEVRLSKSAQVRMIGNSVCPPMAAALVKANFAHEQQIVRAA